MMVYLKRVEIGLAIGLVVLIGVSLLIGQWIQFPVTLAIAKSLVVIGLVILWRTGLVPFGQALYFGIGAYTVGLAGQFWKVSDAFLLVIAGAVISGLIAYILSFLIARYREIFFAMISLAFSMILYGVLVKMEMLGGTDGFNISSPTYFGFAPKGSSLLLTTLLFTCLIAYLGAMGVHRYFRSTVGNLTTAIRDNEIRVEYLGISVFKVVQTSYVIAATLAGAGGAITAFAVGHIDPDAMVFWTVSGEFVFTTILGGTGSVAAPFIGSLIFQFVRTMAFQYFPSAWQMVLGGVLLLMIMFLPNGIWSLMTRFQTPPEKGVEK